MKNTIFSGWIPNPSPILFREQFHSAILGISLLLFTCWNIRSNTVVLIVNELYLSKLSLLLIILACLF